jgi:type II secretory ATPase GspE/PulE/Tfp pilus assembly ATPase PilB-like protein
VLRVLNPSIIALELAQLGLISFQEEIVRKELQKPNGLILVTGPTGSGKTTTLYAFLREVNKEQGIKIITIEDPIEYHVSGIEQTQADPKKGYDFSNGLRSILRQDPDVILVGEMRDIDTVQTAMHASLTGHLVFSTLHTNDAAGIIPRLIDIGAQAPIIAPALNLGIAQRLIRKVCTKCSLKTKATPEQLGEIRETLNEMPEVYMKRQEVPDGTELMKTVGCPFCNDTGYKGRIGVFELFLIDDEIEKLIMTKPSDVDVKLLARRKGMINMREDAMMKVLKGITTIEEVERVVG